MQERCALQSDVDERRAHSGQYPVDPAKIEIADEASPPRALDHEFLQDPVFHKRDAGFLGRDVDENLFGHRGKICGLREWAVHPEDNLFIKSLQHRGPFRARLVRPARRIFQGFVAAGWGIEFAAPW